MSVEVEVWGLKVFGRHGVLEDERRDGQWFSVDVTLGLAAVPPADSLAEAVDYRDVAGAVCAVVETTQFRLIETLAAAVADDLLERFPAVERASVRVGKPDVTLDAGGNPRVSVERRRD